MSRFKWQDLIDLNSKEKSYLSPLACIAHIDVNAFFAQAEQVRCGYSRDDPVVAVQWSSILAISYSARQYNISRMDSIHDALKKCDKLIPVHTAVFRKGEDYWQYHDGCGLWVKDEKKKLSPTNYKVALEPYRKESRKIIKMILNEFDLVEKASVDEVFVDLGRSIFKNIMIDESYDEFADIRKTFYAGSYSLDDFLPHIPQFANLNFEGHVFNPNNKPLFEDWDDVILCLGSISTKKIRDEIDRKLGYTTSCGISMTKSTSKLASNFKKPDAQTVVKNTCMEDFLDSGAFEINSFWTLGGIKGKELFSLMDLPSEGSIKFIRDSWPVSYEEIAKFLSQQVSIRGNSEEYTITESIIPALSEKIFQLARGRYRTEIAPRPLPKSMMSNKNMRNDDCKSVIDCLEWLEVFCSELNNRTHDLEQEYEKTIIPRTAMISIRGKAGMKHTQSKRITVTGSVLSARDLFICATNLMNELDVNYGKNPGVYPLRNLSLTVSNFDVINHGKSVVEMFGNRVMNKRNTAQSLDDVESIGAVSYGETDENHKDMVEEISNPIKSEPTSLELSLHCNQCTETFTDFTALQEHTDYHLSVQLSERINGASEDSAYLTHAERILLFGKRSKKSVNSPGKQNNAGILKFFKK